MNADNIRKEIEKLAQNLAYATDTTIRRALKHRMADLERKFEELKEKGKAVERIEGKLK